jgi:hypothetical protein
MPMYEPKDAETVENLVKDGRICETGRVLFT